MLKKISVVFLAVIMVFSAVIPSYANDAESEYSFFSSAKLYKNPEDESSYLMLLDINDEYSAEKYIDFSESGKLFRIGSDGERELIKEFGKEDDYFPEWDYGVVHDSAFTLPISKSVIAEGTDYVITLADQMISCNGTTQLLPVEFFFSYNELFNGWPTFLFSEIEIEATERADLKRFILLPIDYTGESFIEEYVFMSDKFFSIRNYTEICAETEGEKAIYLKDICKTYDTAKVTVTKDKADNIGELLERSGEKLFDGGISAAKKGGENLLITILTMFSPILLLLSIPLSFVGL